MENIKYNTTFDAAYDRGEKKDFAMAATVLNRTSSRLTIIINVLFYGFIRPLYYDHRPVWNPILRLYAVKFFRLGPRPFLFFFTTSYHLTSSTFPNAFSPIELHFITAVGFRLFRRCPAHLQCIFDGLDKYSNVIRIALVLFFITPVRRLSAIFLFHLQVPAVRGATIK